MSQEETDQEKDMGNACYVRPCHQEMVPNFLQLLADENLNSDWSSLAEARVLLADCFEARATDLHLDSSSSWTLIRLRIDGELFDVAKLSHENGTRLCNQFKAIVGIDPSRIGISVTGRESYRLGDREFDLRVTIVPTISGEKMALRLLEKLCSLHPLEQLGLSQHGLQQLHQWLGDVHGMLLVTGPTGGGKTTTLYALVNILNQHQRNLITIEDPVEYQIDGINQIQVNELEGLTFLAAVRSMLRLDPDYLFLGEIRDNGSARAALNAAASGHALLSSLHSRDAVGAITVFRNFGLKDHEIAANLSHIISQRLVRKLCTECRTKGEISDEDKQWLEDLGHTAPTHTWHSNGCRQCHDLGFLGRTGVFEVWRIDEEDYNMILTHQDEHQIHQNLHRRGHHFLLDVALAKVNEGITTISELRKVGGFRSRISSDISPIP